MKSILAYSAFALGMLAFTFAGCGSKEGGSDAGDSATPASTSGDAGDHDDHDGHDHGEKGHDHDGHDHGKEGHDHDDHDGHDHGKDGGQADAAKKIEANLAKLSPEDATLAKAQKICPVTGDPLGKMGVPQKVDVNGKPVLICCKGCKGRLLKDPEKYLAKLKN